MNKYHDRAEAGKILADALKDYANRNDVIVLGLPRGGVPVAYEIAEQLHLPLDVFIVRKLGVPDYDELAMGAIASGGVIIFNEDILKELTISQDAIDHVISAEEKELKRRERVYRGNRPFPEIENKVVILVDDGIATGATMRAAVKALRKFHPTVIIIAVPVAEKAMVEQMEKIADKLVCPLRPTVFHAVGAWYENFGQTTDEEVRHLLT